MYTWTGARAKRKEGKGERDSRRESTARHKKKYIIL